jgi:FkbM family methyltransferase
MAEEMDTPEARFRRAKLRADRLYAISEEEPLVSRANWRRQANEEPDPRPDLALTSLSPAACAVIERYWRICPTALAAELAEGRYLTADEASDPPVVFTFTSRSGTSFFCHCAYQAGLTLLPPIEIMHPEMLPFLSLSLGAVTVSHYLHLMSLFYQRREAGIPRRFAFKLSYTDYLTLRSSGYWRYWAPRAFYARLRRVNIERQAASLYKSLTTDQWSSFQAANGPFILNTDGLIRIYDNLLDEENLWDQFYSEHEEIAATTFFFEEFRAEPIGAIRELLRCLFQSSAAAAEPIRLDRVPTSIQSDTVDQILEDLIRSLRGMTTTELVRRLYRLVLERPAEAKGLEYWTAIAETQGFEAILGPIFNSDERRGLKARKEDALAVSRRAVKEPMGALRDPYYGHCTAQDVRELENTVDAFRNVDFRVTMTASCRDCDAIPKIENAGRVVSEDNEIVQIMHNGIRVLADGYYGPWMTEIIRRLRGHHEPQEELVFYHVLQLIRGQATMVEVGGFWCYYSMWFLQGDRSQRRAFVIEPDPNHLAVARRNAELNGLTIELTQAAAGRESREAVAFATETAGPQTIKQISVPTFLTTNQLSEIDILHCDAQGVEFDVLQSCERLFKEHAIRFAFISTHDKSFSGDPLTHQRCLAFLRLVGARILAEHDVHESYSGDGLIVAYSGKEEIAWPELRLSYNRYSSSLSRNPLIDLTLAQRNLV